MRTKFLLAICLAVLTLQTVCHAEAKTQSKEKNSKPQTQSQAQPQSQFAMLSMMNKMFTRNSKPGLDFDIWPIFMGGGTFFFSEEGPDSHYPGYSLSGGLTSILYEKYIYFFIDALYSYRAYEGTPSSDVSPVNFRIEETTADLGAAIGYGIFYLGCYVQFPLSTTIRVREWTLDDFSGISRTTSFSGMAGIRITGDHLGIDLRVLLGQGPGQFLKSSLGDHWLGQVSLGFMGGF